jgi:hypothetical protein
MNVVSLNSVRDRESDNTTDSVVRMLNRMEHAHALRGLAVTLKGLDGKERTFVTGEYRDDPEQGLKACLRLSWELTKLQDPPA